MKKLAKLTAGPAGSWSELNKQMKHNDGKISLKKVNLKAYMAITKIRENCKPFLKEKVIMYRGSHKKIELLRKTRRRKLRKPKDTDIRVHKIAEKFFMKKFGWKPRSQGVFAVGSYSAATYYGNAYYFFPIGSYRYLWSPDKSDFYLGAPSMKTDLDMGHPSRVENKLETLIKTYKDTGLKTAVEKQTFEVMFDVDSFYLMSNRIIEGDLLEKHLFSKSFKKEDVVL